MYNRRRNYEHGRIKRSTRKNKTSETFNSIFGTYFKLIAIWASILVLEFFTDFRFEFIWSCWLMMRTVSDSFRYQGLAFALFFTLIALTADLICYFLVPTTLIYLLGSSCVWMQLIWQTEDYVQMPIKERDLLQDSTKNLLKFYFIIANIFILAKHRGIYIPTVALCFLFFYVEVAVRLRDPKNLPLSVDLCRPFAAHCIGYPVVTLGFGLKSMISHQFRLRRQRSVEMQNVTFFTILEEALPKEFRYFLKSENIPKSKRPLNAIENSPTSAGCTSGAIVNFVSRPVDTMNCMATLNAKDKSHAPCTSQANNRKQLADRHSIISTTSSTTITTSSTSSVTNSLTCESVCNSNSPNAFNFSSPLLVPNCLNHHSVALETDHADSTAYLLDDNFANLNELANSSQVGGTFDSHPFGLSDSSVADIDTPGSSCQSATNLRNDSLSPLSTTSSWSCSSHCESGSIQACDHLLLSDLSKDEPKHNSKKSLANSISPTTTTTTTTTTTKSTVNNLTKIKATPPNVKSTDTKQTTASSNVCLTTSVKTSTTTTTAVTSNSSVSHVGACGRTCSDGVVSCSNTNQRPTNAANNGAANGVHTPTTSTNSKSNAKPVCKDDYTIKLEMDAKRFKSELQTLRNMEVQLRSQIEQLLNSERIYRFESSQAQQESENLQAKLNQLTHKFQSDKANVQAAEKRLAEERKHRLSLEHQLKLQTMKRNEEANGASMINGTSSNCKSKSYPSTISRSTSPCVFDYKKDSRTCPHDYACSIRISELEKELSTLTKNHSKGSFVKSDIAGATTTTTSDALSSHKNNHGCVTKSSGGGRKSKTDYNQTAAAATDSLQNVIDLASRVNILKQENQRLADTLKEEDRMKQELMTAYHSSLKEITELNATLTKKEYQIVELNMRIDYLTPHLCEYVNMLNFSGLDTAKLTSNLGSVADESFALGSVASSTTTCVVVTSSHTLGTNSSVLGSIQPAHPYSNKSFSNANENGFADVGASQLNHLNSYQSFSSLYESNLASLGNCSSNHKSNASLSYHYDSAFAKDNKSLTNANFPNYSHHYSNPINFDYLASCSVNSNSMNHRTGATAAAANSNYLGITNRSNAASGSYGQAYANQRFVAPHAKHRSDHKDHNNMFATQQQSSANCFNSIQSFALTNPRPLPVGSSASVSSPAPLLISPPGLFQNDFASTMIQTSLGSVNATSIGTSQSMNSSALDRNFSPLLMPEAYINESFIVGSERLKCAPELILKSNDKILNTPSSSNLDFGMALAANSLQSQTRGGQSGADDVNPVFGLTHMKHGSHVSSVLSNLSTVVTDAAAVITTSTTATTTTTMKSPACVTESQPFNSDNVVCLDQNAAANHSPQLVDGHSKPTMVAQWAG